MAFVEKMAFYRKVGISRMLRKGSKISAIAAGLAVALILFYAVAAPTVSAAVSTPQITESTWRTGEIQVCYTGVDPGVTLMMFAATHDTPGVYGKVDEWITPAGEGCHISKYFENGQTVWFYLLASNNGDLSEQSVVTRQTPPITAYIINWDDMLFDLNSMTDSLKKTIDDGNDKIIDAMKDVSTPSDAKMQEVADAVEEVKNAIGGGSAKNVGDQLQGSFNNIGATGKPPISNDDGIGTFTGGADPSSGSPTNMIQPPNLSGTKNEATICFNLTKKMDGTPYEACIFTNEQMDKLKWWAVVYKAMELLPWLMMAVYLVQRFTPQFKV
jgi:hypothetical protein